jgi:hypothetical protein
MITSMNRWPTPVIGFLAASAGLLLVATTGIGWPPGPNRVAEYDQPVFAPNRPGPQTTQAGPKNTLPADFKRNGLILVSPQRLEQLRKLAAAASPRWLAFRARLDRELNEPILTGYQGSGLQAISDYALAYQVLKNTDPKAAARYADKAIAGLKSGFRDYQANNTNTRQFLARGDGVQTRFELPETPSAPSSFKAYLGSIVTQPIKRGKGDNDETKLYYGRFLEVSRTADGPAEFVESRDWRYNANLPNNKTNVIDWSLPGASRPALGETYYVTWTSRLYLKPALGASLAGGTVTFQSAPARNQAIFVQYVHGTHAQDSGALAYQQTSAGDGGFNSILIDSGYTSRFLGKHLGTALDWLWDYPGLSSSLKNEAVALLLRWSDYLRDHGYHVRAPASNYGTGIYISRVITALALAGRHAEGPRLVKEIVDYRVKYVLPLLQEPTTSLKGGFWAEGWNYGQLATQNMLLAGLALENSGAVPRATVERDWASEVIRHLVSAQAHPGTIYDGGDWYKYPAPYPGRPLFYVLAHTASDAKARGYANYVLHHHAEPDTLDYLDFLYHDPSAKASFWSDLPLQHFASGTGLLTARSDWGPNPTWLAVQIGNPLAANHQTFSPGMMEIRRGPDELLINGNAPGGFQTISAKTKYTNTVVIDDNGERAQVYRFNMGVWYGTPGVIVNAYEAAKDYVYLSGDYRAAYSSNNKPGAGGSATELTRQVVYLRPNKVVVYDRVATIKDTYAKQLRWHFLPVPAVSGNGFQVTVGKSKLFGQSFSSEPLKTRLVSEKVAGKVIQEVITENAHPVKSIRYMTAFQIAPTSSKEMIATRHVADTSGRLEGLQIGNHLVLFGTAGQLDPAVALKYQVTATGKTQHLVTDLRPGQPFLIKVDGTQVARLTASAQGTLSFATASAGPHAIEILADR